MVTDPPAAPGPAGIYLHFPFCAIRCSYCDFATVAGRDERIDGYLTALRREIELFQHELPQAVDTIFVGGGTPSRMRPDQLAGLLEAVRRRFDVDPATEVTVECNPESVDRDKLFGYADAGVNRVSIGVQSLDDRVLGSVGRAHDAGVAEGAVATALDVPGLEVGVDLIAGLPGEDPAGWEATLRRVAGWGTAHLSVYLLETDKNTPLARSIRAGRTPRPDEDVQAAFYRSTARVLEACGFDAYEISNFSRGGRRSRHNVKYWTDAWYGGFGLGAHGYAAGRRRANTRSLDRYLESLDRRLDPGEEIDPWSPTRRIEEALILGLRLSEGPDVDDLATRYELDLRTPYEGAWRSAEAAGWVSRTAAGRPRLTASGRLFSNRVFVDLLDRLPAPDMS